MAEGSRTLTQDTQLFRDVFNASPIGIAVENLEGQPLFVNPAFCSMLGFNEEELRSKHCVQFSPPEDAEKDWALFQQLRAGSIDHYQLEKRYFRRDGSLMWGRLSISLLNNRSSPLVIAMVEDITEKKKAEEALFRHTTIVESSEDAIASGTLDGIIVSWNRGAQHIYGYTEAEAVGKPISILIPPELPDEENKILETLRAGGRIEHFETVRVTKTGKRINVSLSISPIRDSSGKTVGCCGIARDVTQRKQAEQALHESEERFRLVANNAPVMIWMSGLDKEPTYFNQLWLDFTGLSETDLRNGLAGIVHPEDYLQCHDVYCRGFDRRQPFRKECRLRRHDGEYRWMLDVGVPRFHKDGSFAGYIGSCIDVTDRKLTEDVLTNMSRKLVEAQEQERARIARELHDDISQRLAMLAIELERLRDNPSEVQSRVPELRKQTTEISNDVQALSHELHSSKLEYLGAIRGMKSWCEEFGERQGLQIEFKSPEAQTSLPPEVGVSLFRVLQEALHNAAKHSGVSRIEVQLREDSGEIHLIVSDLGRGLDVETAMQGRGLGLTSMRERVRLVNGTIAIQSKPMGGTTVHVRVPLGWGGDSIRAAG
jgi:PAS domain S-box-containing protein